MSDTCNLFPLFGDPWPSCLLPSQREERPVVIIPTLSLHREGSESCLYGNRGDMWSLALSTESNMLDATGRRLFTSQDPTKQAGPSTMTFREEAGLLALQAQLSLIAQSCPTLCDPMDCSMPGFPVHHQLPELAQTHVHQVGDAIQLSHPLPSPTPPAFNLSQHQGLFQGVSSSPQVAKGLELQLQHQSFQ